MNIACNAHTHTFHLRSHPISCQIGKTMGMRERQESQQGLNLAHHWELIKTQSCSLPGKTHTGQHPYTHSYTHSLLLHSHPGKLLVTPSLFHTNNVLHSTRNHAHTHRKIINLLSHMGTHIVSQAITLWHISNYPVLQGTELMYETAQINIGSYLSLWPMTWVYLHYAVAHFKSFTSVGGYGYGRHRGELGMFMRISPNASPTGFSLPS